MTFIRRRITSYFCILPYPTVEMVTTIAMAMATMAMAAMAKTTMAKAMMAKLPMAKATMAKAKMAKATMAEVKAATRAKAKVAQLEGPRGMKDTGQRYEGHPHCNYPTRGAV